MKFSRASGTLIPRAVSRRGVECEREAPLLRLILKIKFEVLFQIFFVPYVFAPLQSCAREDLIIFSPPKYILHFARSVNLLGRLHVSLLKQQTQKDDGALQSPDPKGLICQDSLYTRV